MLIRADRGHVYQHDEEGRVILAHGEGVLHLFLYDAEGVVRVTTQTAERWQPCPTEGNCYPAAVARFLNAPTVTGDHGYPIAPPLPGRELEQVIERVWLRAAEEDGGS